MLPGPEEFFSCPNCGNILSRETLMSGNTFGAKLFSDGKQISPMLPDVPEITKCLKCNTIFWLDEERGIKNQQSTNVDKANFLTIYEYLTAIENKIYKSKGDEFFIRMRIWWGFNDRVRNGGSLFISEADKAIWTENTNRLIEMLDREDINQRITLAELQRNLGNFQKCKDILETITSSDFSWLREAFSKEIANENKNVFQLN